MKSSLKLALAIISILAISFFSFSAAASNLPAKKYKHTKTNPAITKIINKRTSITASNKKIYDVSAEVMINNKDYPLNTLVVILPLPQNIGDYQIISDINTNGGDTITDSTTGAQYVRYTLNNSPAQGESRTVKLNYKATLKNINTAFATTSGQYQNSTMTTRYTSQNLPYIDPQESRIQAIGDNLWQQANKNKVEYARLAYEYVARHYQYTNPNTGIYPLDTILNQNGGDCGNLTSIYISLLRYQNIPARHDVGVLTNGTFHAWAEFLTPDGVWVPADVTYKNSDTQGDYFGKFSSDGYRIIFNHDFNIALNTGVANWTPNVPLLQTFGWWIWGNSDQIDGHITPAYSIKIEPVN